MRCGSVCSGIGAPECAWKPLGWHSVFVSEIEPFPSAVLVHHYPDVPNLGDFTTIGEEFNGAIDVLVGGTPCQDFSVAGLRAGMDGKRGQLTVEFARLAGRIRPKWLVWENVPGVLSTDGGRAFGTFLGLMGQFGYRFAYRILDAQYFGVAQRRRRVFVVGHLGDWRRAAAVLFERDSLSGNPAPRREAGEGITPILEAGARTGVSTTDPRAGMGIGSEGDPMFSLQAGKQHAVASTGDVSHCLNAGGMGRQDYETETLITHSLRADGFDASEDGTGRGTPIVPTYALQSVNTVRDKKQNGIGISQDGTMYSLTGRDQHAIAFSAKDHGADALEDCSPTLRSCGDYGVNGGPMPAVAISFAENQRGEIRTSEVSPQLSCAGGKPGSGYPSVAVNLRGRDGGAMPECDDVASLRAASGGSSRSCVAQMAVRRLTPRECERLQGFPDDYTLIQYKNKPAADGPRYKALGNSMAVPVMRWIGERIQMVEGVTA